MPTSSPARRVRALAGAAAWTTTLVLLLLALLARTPDAARAQEGDPSPGGSGDVDAAAVTAGVSVTLGVDTPASNGFVSSTDAVNGDIVTYRIRIFNASGSALSAMRFEAVLPTAGLADILCPGCTNTRTSVVTRTNAVGDSERVTITRELGWTLAGQLANNAGRDVIFTARVVGQAGGPAIENTALAFYQQGALSRSGVSNKVRLAVVADVPDGAVVRATAVVSTPNWFSADQGGTLDMDWGDVDNDGDLDLALASTLGTYVYSNNGGQLELLWSDPQRRTVFGVRWLDVDVDGTPELVAIGTPTGAAGGANYVFRYNPGTLQSPDRFQIAENGLFTTAEQLTRIETGRFNNDALPDLLVSVNAISAECPVFVLYNQGTNLFQGAPRCVSGAGSAAISAADTDNDGDLDAALGLFPNQIRVFLAANGVLTQTNPAVNTLFVDAPSYFLPYDFAWGDMDRDGDLDLAASFPLQRQVRIYRNLVRSPGVAAAAAPGFELLQPILTTGVFLTPYALDWGDMDRDGGLDLIVADANPTIYWNTLDPAQPLSAAAAFRTEIPLAGERGEVWSIRAIDQDGDGALELAIANRNGPSLLLANYAPALAGGLTQIADAGTAGSVAWGDVNNDGLNDLLLGAAPNRNTSRLFLNDNGGFSFEQAVLFDADAIGRQTAMLGDLDADLIRSADGGRLDVILVTPTGLRISRNQGELTTLSVPGLNDVGQAAALGDADGDGDLDLAVATSNGPIYLVENRPGQQPPQRIVALTGALAGTTSLAWGDLDGDHYLDLAVGSAVQNRVLVNNSDLTFRTLDLKGTTTCPARPTQALAWGDLDGDGDLDLALANDPGPSCILLNNAGTLTPFQQFSAGLRAAALDWGDWDNDSDLDLAVGHRGARVRTYANIGGRLVFLWQSDESYEATAVRFGDKDADGDLDLALAQATEGRNSGIFENRTVAPAHFLAAAQINPLRNQSAYVFVRRPGATRSAYEYSTSELLAGPRVPTVTVEYRIFDPDGDESSPPTQVRVLVAYSLDGGGRWETATPAPGQGDVVTATLSRAGEDHLFRWNAQADGAIGERAFVRVTVVNPTDGGLVQSAAGVGVSPPFQVRGTTCIWPANPRIFVDGLEAANGSSFPVPAGRQTVELEFGATLAAGSGLMRYLWDFGVDVPGKVGQRVKQTLRSGSYTVKLTAQGEACPQRRLATRTVTFRVGTGLGDTFLPLVSGTPPTETVSTTVASAVTTTVLPAAEPLPPVPIGVTASSDGATVTLLWMGGRADLAAYVDVTPPGSVEAARSAALPGTAGRYEGPLVCGASYSVAFVMGMQESVSEESWLAPPCEEGAP